MREAPTCLRLTTLDTEEFCRFINMNEELEEFYEDCIDGKDIVAFTWKGKSLSEMTTSHIENCINFLKRKNKNFFTFEIAVLEQELKHRNNTYTYEN